MTDDAGPTQDANVKTAVMESKVDQPMRPGSASPEVLRLQNALKVKERELDELKREMGAQRALVVAKDRAIGQKESELRVAKEHSLAMDGEFASLAKELATLKTEKRKMETQLAGLVRQSDKQHLLSQSMQLDKPPNGSTSLRASMNGGASGSATPPPGLASGGTAQPLPTNDYMATLQAELRLARMDGDKQGGNVRALENVLRGKEKLITILEKKADEADGHHKRSLELENKLLEAQKNIEDLKQQLKQADIAIRARDADKARLQHELDKARDTIGSLQEAAARTGAALRAAELRNAALDTEVGVLSTQLARTSAVAKRVAVAEVKAGPRDEGTVHVTRHIEEMRFMTGETTRLQDRIAGLQKELAVSHELKEQYKRIATQPPGAPGATTPGERPGSARASPMRRPLSAPRGSAVRSSTGGGIPTPPAATGSAADPTATSTPTRSFRPASPAPGGRPASPAPNRGSVRPASPGPAARSARPASPAPGGAARPSSPAPGRAVRPSSPAPGGAARPASPAPTGAARPASPGPAGRPSSARLRSSIPSPSILQTSPLPKSPGTTGLPAPGTVPWNSPKGRLAGVAAAAAAAGAVAAPPPAVPVEVAAAAAAAAVAESASVGTDAATSTRGEVAAPAAEAVVPGAEGEGQGKAEGPAGTAEEEAEDSKAAA